MKGRSHYSDNQSPISDNHFLGVVAGGCQRSANVCRWSVIGCQRITSTTSRRPPTTTFLFGGFRRFSVVIADQSAIGCQNSLVGNHAKRFNCAQCIVVNNNAMRDVT